MLGAVSRFVCFGREREAFMELKPQQIAQFAAAVRLAAEKWGVTGHVSVRLGGDTLFDGCFGGASEQTRYVVSGLGRSFVGLVYLALTGSGTVREDDALAKYLPEYAPGARVTLRQLAEDRSGVPDWFYERRMVALHADPAHEALPEEQRFVLERTLAARVPPLPELLALLGPELSFAPGLRVEDCESNRVLLAAALSRAAGKPWETLLSELVFAPLGVSPRFGAAGAAPLFCRLRLQQALPLPDAVPPCPLTLTAADARRMADGLCAGAPLRARQWKRAQRIDERGLGLAFSRADGMDIFSLDACGIDSSLYVDRALSLRIVHLTNAELRIDTDAEGNWCHFRKELRAALTPLTTWPRHPRIVPYGPKNWFETCDLRVREDQAQFVSDARTAICCALAFRRTHRVWVMQEGERPVGLLILEIDPKKNEYWIDSVLIDKRYQGRGYGRLMVGFGVSELKRRGARQLSIGVNRFNIPAQRLYASLGFRPAEVFEDGMMLRIDLD